MPQTIPTAEPFFLPGQGNNARIGCLVTHGFTGAPKEVHWLGEFLNRQGYTVCGMRLTGHATRPEDMIRSRWRDWLLSVEDGYHLLHSCTDQIFLLGLSMGGVLSLSAAAQFPVKGVVAMSTPYELPRLPIPLWMVRFLSRFKPYMAKRAVPGGGWFDQAAYAQHVAYPMNPVRSVVELKLLIEEMHKALPKISVPVLLIHSRDDDYVIKDSMQQIHNHLGTSDKQMLWMEGGGHVITEEPTGAAVFKAAADFVQRVSPIYMSLELILLSISLFTWGIGEGMFVYFQPIYLQQLGANTMTIASVFSLFGLAMMVAHIPAGHLADRIGRKPLLIAAWSSGVLATWIMALARTLPVFIVGMLLYGFTAFVSSPLNSYVTAARGKLSPVRAMTLISAAYNLGAVLGPISGGWIGGRHGLRSIYLVSACIFIVSTVVLFFLRSQAHEVHDPAAPPEKLWKNTRFVGFLGIIFLAMFVMYLPQPLTPAFLQNERGLSLENIGLLGSIGSMGNALLALAMGLFAARSGFLLAQISVAVFCLLIWKGTGLGWYALGYFLLGGFRSVRSLIYAQVRPLIHPAQMGLAYGVAETFSSLAIMLAPLLAGVLYTLEAGRVYWVSIGLIAVILIISGIFTPRAMDSGELTVISTPPEG